MRHHILVKWNDTMPHPDIAPIRALFLETLRIPGIQDVSLYPNIIHRPNRYDLMIVITMEKKLCQPMMPQNPTIAGRKPMGNILRAKLSLTANNSIP